MTNPTPLGPTGPVTPLNLLLGLDDEREFLRIAWSYETLRPLLDEVRSVGMDQWVDRPFPIEQVRFMVATDGTAQEINWEFCAPDEALPAQEVELDGVMLRCYRNDEGAFLVWRASIPSTPNNRATYSQHTGLEEGRDAYSLTLDGWLLWHAAALLAPDEEVRDLFREHVDEAPDRAVHALSTGLVLNPWDETDPVVRDLAPFLIPDDLEPLFGHESAAVRSEAITALGRLQGRPEARGRTR